MKGGIQSAPGWRYGMPISRHQVKVVTWAEFVREVEGNGDGPEGVPTTLWLDAGDLRRAQARAGYTDRPDDGVRDGDGNVWHLFAGYAACRPSEADVPDRGLGRLRAVEAEFSRPPIQAWRVTGRAGRGRVFAVEADAVACATNLTTQGQDAGVEETDEDAICEQRWAAEHAMDAAAMELVAARVGVAKALQFGGRHGADEDVAVDADYDARCQMEMASEAWSFAREQMTIMAEVFEHGAPVDNSGWTYQDTPGGLHS